MNVQELLNGARKDPTNALNLCSLITMGVLEVHMAELLESFLILLSWREKLEQAVPNEEAHQIWIEMFQAEISRYEKIFEECEFQVLSYLSVVKEFLPKYVEEADEFIKQIQGLDKVPASLKNFSL